MKMELEGAVGVASYLEDIEELRDELCRSLVVAVERGALSAVDEMQIRDLVKCVVDQALAPYLHLKTILNDPNIELASRVAGLEEQNKELVDRNQDLSITVHQLRHDLSNRKLHQMASRFFGGNARVRGR